MRSSGQRTETEDRGQKTEDRRQKTEDRGQMTEKLKIMPISRLLMCQLDGD
jgi:hypothetical protein